MTRAAIFTGDTSTGYGTWKLTEDPKIILGAEDPIFVDTSEELVAVLQAQHPTPEGTTRVTTTPYTENVYVHKEIIATTRDLERLKELAREFKQVVVKDRDMRKVLTEAGRIGPQTNFLPDCLDGDYQVRYDGLIYDPGCEARALAKQKKHMEKFGSPQKDVRALTRTLHACLKRAVPKGSAGVLQPYYGHRYIASDMSKALMIRGVLLKIDPKGKWRRNKEWGRIVSELSSSKKAYEKKARRLEKSGKAWEAKTIRSFTRMLISERRRLPKQRRVVPNGKGPHC